MGNNIVIQNLLGCTAVFLIKCRPTLQRYVLPPLSGRSVNIQIITRQYIPQYSKLHTHTTYFCDPGSSVSIVSTGWTTGRSRFDPRQRQRIFPLASVSRPALGPTQPPVQWVTWVLSPGVTRPGRDADHSPPCSAEIENDYELYLLSPQAPSWRIVGQL
jgi:hypothetical protein